MVSFSVTLPRPLRHDSTAGLAGGAPVACGPGSISDLFSERDRALAMAIYSLGPLLGMWVKLCDLNTNTTCLQVQYLVRLLVASLFRLWASNTSSLSSLVRSIKFLILILTRRCKFHLFVSFLGTCHHAWYHSVEGDLCSSYPSSPCHTFS